MEEAIQKLKVIINDKIDIYGTESIEVKKYKQLLDKIIKINKKLKVIGLDKQYITKNKMTKALERVQSSYFKRSI